MSEIAIDESKLIEYVLNAKDYCLVNGLVIFPKQNSTNENNDHNYAQCLPITLLPTKFSKNDFNYALNIQNSINLLVHYVSINQLFLNEALHNIIQVDEFTRRLWTIYETVVNEGITQPISFGIIRSDYMIDANKFKNNDDDNNKCHLSQVEINTIASSFGAATHKLYKLHRYMLKLTNNERFIEQQPVNENLDFLAKSMVKAWSLYGNSKAQIAFLVNKSERNLGDQRLLEYEIISKESNVKIIRLTFEQIDKYAKLDADKRLFLNDVEIGLVYYRAGYDPKDYETENSWNARLLIERSKAIKCPSIQYHLSGAKKIQQALFESGCVEKFLDAKSSSLVRATFVDQYSFDNKNDSELDKLIEMMLENCKDYVLKPQREGGGNNIYGTDIKDFVNSLKDKSELRGYILMKLIKPLQKKNYMIKNDTIEAIKSDFINEIGIYGAIIGDNDKIYYNEIGGYLLRSKLPTTNEGGVAAGFSALDSIYLE